MRTGGAGPRLSRRALLLAAGLWPAAALAQKKKPAPATGPAMSAARTIVAGAPLSVFLSRPPQGARLAIARPEHPASSAIVASAGFDIGRMIRQNIVKSFAPSSLADSYR